MNFKIFSFICSILLVTKEIESSKKYQTPDMKPISTRFADLLSSLVKVNEERVDALKNLFKLYDVNRGKQALRTTPDEEVSKNERDEYPEVNKLLGLVPDNMRLCYCKDKDFDRDEQYEDFEEQPMSRGNDANQIFNNDDLSLETDRVIFISLDNQLSKERENATSSEEDIASQDELVSKPFKSPLGRQSRSRTCISPSRGYQDCKDACKEAYGKACSKYSCREKLYQQLRKDCKKQCKKRFKEAYEDYDYYDYY